MGVHDYVCFVERNGQDLRGFEPTERPVPFRREGYRAALSEPSDTHLPAVGAPEEDGEDESSVSTDDDLIDPFDYDGEVGCGIAVLVKVPTAHARQEILSWKLSEFERFPTVRAEYDYDGWCFEKVEGYNADGAIYSSHWYEQAVWRSPTYPDTWLVNFHPKAYEAFVRGEIPPERIPARYWEEVFGNRGRPLPPTKREAYAAVVDSGRLNLWELDGSPPPEPLKLPPKYVALRQKLEEAMPPATAYTLMGPLPGFTKARLGVLLGDHIEATVGAPLEVVRPRPNGPGYSFLEYHESAAGWALVSLSFRLTADVTLPARLTNRCLACPALPDLGSHFCLRHAGYAGQPGTAAELRRGAEQKIAEYAEGMCARIEGLLLAGLAPPDYVEARFEDRCENYRLRLSRAPGGADAGPAPVPEGPSFDPGDSAWLAYWTELGLGFE